MRDIDDLARERLLADGQRYTPARRLLLHTLVAAGQPLSIEALRAVQPSLVQSSAYRNLGVLEHAGLVQRISTAGKHTFYEPAEELTDHHHHHLVCTSCGAVSDVTLPAAAEAALERALDDVAARAGFRVDDHRLDLLGCCQSCSAERV